MARTEWGMSARDLWERTPQWEVDALLDERERLRREAEREQNR